MTTQRPRGRSISRRTNNTPNRLPLMLALMGALIAVVVGAVLVFGGSSGLSEEKALQEGRDHVAETERVTYTMNPPTSGNHSARTARWGFYKTDPPLDENLVHNLEHGAVIIWYNPDKVSEAEYNQLFAVFQKMSDDEFRTILVARPSLESKIALSAWGVLARFDAVNEKAMLEFQANNKLNGPECQNKICPTQ